MKKITHLAFLMIVSLGYAQNGPITFEAGGFGASWTWNTFENPSTPCPALIIGANPSATGLNTSATVASYTPVVGAPFYAGTETAHGMLGTFTLSASNSTIKILVRKPVISNVGIKFATNSGASTGEINVANTVINQWEELTFDFSGKIGEASSTGIDQIALFLDSNSGRTTNNTCYFDNIRFSAQIASPPSAPTVAAPTPSRPAANVISMFSNAYTNVGVDTWRTPWSSGTLTDLQIAGNDTKKYSSLDFVGIETTGANLINATPMTYFHIDAWTPNMTLLRVKLVDFGANGIYQGTPNDDKEHELTFTPTLSGWNSYDIPLSDFTGLTTRGHIAQLIFSGNPAGSGNLYIDNVYFSNVALANSNFEKNIFKIYPNPTTNTLTIENQDTIDSVSIYNLLGQEVLKNTTSNSTESINVSILQSGVYVVKVSSLGVNSSQKFVKN